MATQTPSENEQVAGHVEGVEDFEGALRVWRQISSRSLTRFAVVFLDCDHIHGASRTSHLRIHVPPYILIGIRTLSMSRIVKCHEFDAEVVRGGEEWLEDERVA